MRGGCLQELMNNTSYCVEQSNRSSVRFQDPNLQEQTVSKYCRPYRYFVKGFKGKLEEITSGPKSLTLNQRRDKLYEKNKSYYMSDSQSSLNLTEEKMEMIIEDQMF